jgi:hypothetical protein
MNMPLTPMRVWSAIQAATTHTDAASDGRDRGWSEQ